MQDNVPISMNAAHPSLSFPYLPRRIAVARTGCGLTQAALSKRLGFKDRQTVAAIEAGERRVGVEELLAIMSIVGRDMEFFTDPFLLVGEGAFSYRASGIDPATLDGFEARVRGWIALWQHLGVRKGERLAPIRPRLAVDEQSSFEEAQRTGEAVALELALGPIPAEKLASALEERFGLLVLNVDTPAGISGAACQMSSGDVILANRNESEGRRNFDLAHELFHVLTWNALPPERVDRENPTGYKQKRIEQLADNFAGGLLMPADALREAWAAKPSEMEIGGWILAMANRYRVSTSALKWRLAAIGLITPSDAANLKDRKQPASAKSSPPLFSRRFIERAAWGIERGEISVRRLATLLGVEIAGLKELFTSNALPVPFDL